VSAKSIRWIVFGKPQMPAPASRVKDWSTGSCQIQVASRFRKKSTTSPRYGTSGPCPRSRTKNASDTSW
jgi:hypothetical protein